MRNNSKSERGAVLVESSIVVMLIVLLLFSVVWGAFVFRTYLTVSHASAGGARTASVAGNALDADYQILQSVKPDLAALGKSSLKRVIVYPATDFDEKPTSACLSSGVGCNTYDPVDLDKTDVQFAAPAFTKDDGFPSAARSVSATAPSFVGVYVEARPMVGSLGLGIPNTLAQYKVFKVEPSGY